MSADFLPQPAQAGASVKAVNRRVKREIMRRLPPFATGIDQIQNGVRQFPLAPFIRPHSIIIDHARRFASGANRNERMLTNGCVSGKISRRRTHTTKRVIISCRLLLKLKPAL